MYLTEAHLKLVDEALRESADRRQTLAERQEAERRRRELREEMAPLGEVREEPAENSGVPRCQ